MVLTNTVSYIISTDGKNTFAVNGNTGNIDYIATDARMVIQKAIDFSEPGSEIKFRRGDYIAENIKVNKSIKLNGEDSATGGKGGTRIYGLGTANTHIFEIGTSGEYNSSNPLRRVKITDMEIGGRSSQYVYGAINADNTSHLIIDNIVVPYINGKGINIGISNKSFNEHTTLRHIYTFGAGPSFIGVSATYCSLFLADNITISCLKGTGIGINLWNVNELKLINIQLVQLAKAIQAQTTRLNIENIWIEAVNYGFYFAWGYGGIVEGLHNAGGVDKLEYYDNNSGSYRIKFLPNTKQSSNILSNTFEIDSTGLKTVTIPHVLPLIPNVQDCNLTVIENTAVDDWSYNLLKVVSTDAINVVAKINVSKASSTVGATAKLALMIIS